MTRLPVLDVLRGFALVCIMLNHMPLSLARHLTFSNFAVFDAAELFVLLSGFLVGIVWLRETAAGGTGVAQRRFALRTVQIWKALLIGAILLGGLCWLLIQAGMPFTATWNGYGRLLAMKPDYYLLAVASLWMQPNLLDVLALYVVLIAAVPLFVPLLAARPLWAVALSVAVWLVGPVLNNLLPNERPNANGLLFNPFSWQLLFFTGTALGLWRGQIGQALRPHGTELTVFSAALLMFGWVVHAAPGLGEAGKPLQDALFLVHGSIDKWSMDGFRYVSIMAAAWLVSVPLAPLFARISDSGAGRGLAEIGRGGLVSFVACVLLSVLGDALQMAVKPALGPRLAIDAAVVLVLWAIARGAAHSSGRRIRRL